MSGDPTSLQPVIFSREIAKTWSRPDCLLGNATTFIEAYGRSDLDGRDRGHTLVPLTPYALACGLRGFFRVGATVADFF